MSGAAGNLTRCRAGKGVVTPGRRHCWQPEPGEPDRGLSSAGAEAMGEGGSLGRPTASWFLRAKERCLLVRLLCLPCTLPAAGQWRPTRKQVGRDERRCLLPGTWPWWALGRPAVISCGQLAGREIGAGTRATERKDRRQLMLSRSRFSLRAP